MLFILGLIIGILFGLIIMDYAYFKRSRCAEDNTLSYCLKEYFNVIKAFFNRLKS